MKKTKKRKMKKNKEDEAINKEGDKVVDSAWCTLEDFKFLTDFKNMGDHRHNDRFNWFLTF